MRAACAVCLLFLAAPGVAYAGEATITSRDIPVGAARAPAAVTPAAAFDMVGLHWRGAGTVSFRTRGIDGSWSAWRAAAPEAEDQPDAGVESARPGWSLGNPWWTGRSDRLEVRMRGAVTRIRAWFVTSPAARIPLRRVSVARSPGLVPRLGWQADERAVRAAPRYAPVLRLAVVHHTAGTNAYRPEESAAIVKGIQLYHVKANGWNDIGYNFLVDRYGQIFEGRGGGADRNVVGAHAEGFNTGSVGVAVIGTYGTALPTKAAEKALVALLSWRLDVSHLDPAASSMITSGGNAKFRPGAGVYLRTVSGHRDTGFTACPGDSLYARLGALTEAIATTGLPKLYDPVARGRLGKIVRFAARLSQPLKWTVTVTGPGGERAASKTGVGDRVSWFWDSSKLPAGRYSWTIEATGVRPARGTLGASPPLPPPPAVTVPPASGLTVTPAVVSPNGDGYEDTATVRYVLAERSTVTVSLVDELGLAVIIPVLESRQPAGTRTLRLDPAVVPDGRYRLVVSARGDSGRSSRLGAAVAVNRALGWLRADPAELTADGDGIGDVVTVSFELAAPAQVTVELRDRGSQLGVVFAEWMQPGPHAVLWDGRLPAGPVPAGSYEIWVTAGTDAGTVTQRVSVTVVVPPPI